MKKNMYLNKQIVKKFARSEKNDGAEHTVVSNILDSIVAGKTSSESKKIAILGAGANPQKYPLMMDKVKKGWKIDWSDMSSYMLEIARNEAQKIDLDEKISFQENDFIGYLNSQENNSLDYIVMQYCINYIENLKFFLKLASEKMKPGAVITANIGGRAVKNSNFATFLVNGKEIEGKVSLVHGDIYTIRFLNERGEIYATTEKTFFSDEEIFSLAYIFGLESRIENIKGFDILILKKK